MALIALGVAGVAVGAYFILRPQPTLPGSVTQAAKTAKNVLQQGEDIIAKGTGVPLAALGNAASKTPGWLQLAVLPVGVTAVTQRLITHPLDTVKSVAAVPAKAAKAVAHVATSAVKATVAAPAKAFHAIESLF